MSPLRVPSPPSFIVFSSRMDFGRLVWVADTREGFTKGTIQDIRGDSLTVRRNSDGKEVAAPYEEVFPLDDADRSVADHCSLLSLNEASLLNNSRLRFSDQLIYTYVGNVLISLNPYEDVKGMYSEEKRGDYKGKSLGKMPPHIYAIAEKARLELRRTNESQSIIVSGESGSGKTESQKYILSYLCHGHATPLQKRILDINPILEAFGNAKTMRNNNSSRFGKFVEVHLEAEKVVGGYISHYLLERSRVTAQQNGERNYHIFYQLIAGCDAETFARLKLDKPHKFNYLKACSQFFGPADKSRSCGEPLSDPLLNDARQFMTVVSALEGTGMKLEQIGQIVSVLAGLLHLGNVSFIDDPNDSRGGCMVEESSESSLTETARLLGVESKDLRSALIARIMQPTKGGVKGTLIRVALKPTEAVIGRDALAKAIYSRMFDWIVDRVNSSIPLKQGDNTKFIGVLDIAGFEFFKRNSFEQLCINYCNEKMQHFFAERVMGEEQRLYQREAIPFAAVEYSNNDDAIDLFEARGAGLFDLLDEEARMPRPSPANFTSNIHKKHDKHFRLDKPRTTKEYRHMRDEDGFLVRHFAGTVCYETREFVEKNKDDLHASLEAVLEGSSVRLLSSIFKTSTLNDAKGGNINRLRSATIGSKFKAQLGKLLERLATTGTHFVRCIKPNDAMRGRVFDGGLVLSQLRCAGIPSLLKLMHNAYPSRIAFTELYSLYARSLPSKLARLEPRLFCKCLFRALGLSPSDFAFGTSKIFFRSGKFAEFDQIVQGESSNVAALVEKTGVFLTRMRWRMFQYGAWSVIKLSRKICSRREALLTIQKFARGHLARKKYRPRVELATKARRLQTAIRSMEGEEAHHDRNTLDHNIQHLLSQLAREDTRIEDAIVAYEECVRRVDTIIASVKEAQALRLERERQEKERMEAEEREKRMEEDRRERKKIEEGRLKEQREYEKRLNEEREQDNREKDRIMAEEMEREKKRLDATLHEGRRAEESPITPKEEVQHDLTTWKYAQLRDAINNSTDIDVLLACKAEFHRRLRVYNEWKARASNQGASHPLPPCRSLPTGHPPLKNNHQRFFKIPLAGTGGQQGLLYVHFDGQWVGRQIEMRPAQKATLLRAGRDDMKMMHLSLEQSGLTRRKGAEIKEDEFETIWVHLGGEPLPTWTP